MVTVDAHALRKRAPADRIKEIAVMKKLIADELAAAETNAAKQQQLLDQLEKEALREFETTERVRVPVAREVEVERLFKREKKLEEQIEDAPRMTQRQDVSYTPRETVNAVYAFTQHHGYEHIASIRDKVAAGEMLTNHEQQTLKRYDQLVHEFERVASKIQDERARDLMSRTEKAIHQIESYKSRKLGDDEPERQQRQEF